MKYENERMEEIPCGNRQCVRGFDEKYEQNCALTVRNGPFCIVCDQYFPAEKHHHNCQGIHLDYLFKEPEYLEGESVGIYRCHVCKQLWKIRWQRSQGTGCDNIWLKPGETERGYSFSLEEAEKL